MWFAFLSWLLWYSILIFFGSRLLWVTPHHLCAFAFLSWLLGDSFYCLRVPASLGPLNLLCALLFCAGFSGIAFVLLGSRLLWVPPPYIGLLCFAILASPGRSFAGLSFRGSFPSFLEMNGMGDFDALLDSVKLISLVECISSALTVVASRLFW